MTRRSEAAQAAQLKKKSAIVDSIRQGTTVTGACDLAGVPRRTTYAWRDKDEEFAAAWDDAVEEGTDRMEDECFRRAVKGTEKPVGFHRGKPGAYVRDYSDTLLIFMLKARRPEKYRDRIETVNNNINSTVALEEEDLEIIERVKLQAVEQYQQSQEEAK